MSGEDVGDVADVGDTGDAGGELLAEGGDDKFWLSNTMSTTPLREERYIC